MASRITYVDKEKAKESEFPENQTWSFENANELKAVIGSHADDIEALEALILSIQQTIVSITEDYELPQASTFSGTLVLYNQSGSNWDVTANGLDTFGGEAVQTIRNNETFEMRVDDTSTNWYI